MSVTQLFAMREPYMGILPSPAGGAREKAQLIGDIGSSEAAFHLVRQWLDGGLYFPESPLRA